MLLELELMLSREQVHGCTQAAASMASRGAVAHVNSPPPMPRNIAAVDQDITRYRGHLILRQKSIIVGTSTWDRLVA